MKPNAVVGRLWDQAAGYLDSNSGSLPSNTFISSVIWKSLSAFHLEKERLIFRVLRSLYEVCLNELFISSVIWKSLSAFHLEKERLIFTKNEQILR